MEAVVTQNLTETFPADVSEIPKNNYHLSAGVL